MIKGKYLRSRVVLRSRQGILKQFFKLQKKIIGIMRIGIRIVLRAPGSEGLTRVTSSYKVQSLKKMNVGQMND